MEITELPLSQAALATIRIWQPSADTADARSTDYSIRLRACGAAQHRPVVIRESCDPRIPLI